MYTTFPNLNNTATITIVVLHGTVVAVIQGGSSRSLPVSLPLTVSAASSFDPDGMPLAYNWQCSTDGGSCTMVNGTTFSFLSGITLQFPPYLLAATTCIIKK